MNKHLQTILKAFMAKHANEDLLWETFLDLFWGGGHKEVPNRDLDPDVLQHYPMVTMAYLYEKDEPFRSEVQDSFLTWKENLPSPPKEISNYIEEYETPSNDEINSKYKFEIELDKNLKKDIYDYITNDINFTHENILRISGLSHLKQKDKVSIYYKVNLDGNIEVSVSNKEEKNKPKVSFRSSIIFKLEEGTAELNAKFLQVPDTGNGIGMKIFTSRVLEAKKANISKITCNAAKRDSDLIGYKVWPKMGYDCGLNSGFNKHSFNLKSFLSTMKDENPGLYEQYTKGPIDPKYRTQYTIQNLYALGPQAAQFWEKHGSSIFMDFDLTDGSKSLSIFNRRLNKALSKQNNINEWIKP
jgi:hypothetical protein